MPKKAKKIETAEDNPRKNRPSKAAPTERPTRARRIRLIALSVFIAFVSLFSNPASFLPRNWRDNPLVSLLAMAEADAAIAFVKNIGTSSDSGSTTSMTVTVPAAGVAAGNSVIITLATDYTSNPVTCSDSRGNTYTIDADRGYSSYARVVVCASHNITALSSGDTITVNYPSTNLAAVSVNEFSGLAGTSTLDKTSTATGTSSTPSSGSTATTTQADELLIGAFALDGPVSDTFTAGSGYTLLTRNGASYSSMGTTYITIDPEYQIVSSTGAYAADGSNSSSRHWAAAIATYKAAIVSGTVYTDEGSTNIGSGKTVRLVVNGSSVGTAVTDSSGNYTIAASTDAGDALLVYIDGDATYKGTTVTVSDGANLTGLDIYANRLIVRHDNGGSLTNADMTAALGAYSDAEILYTTDGGDNLAVGGAASELFVWSGDAYAPGAAIDAVHVDVRGTLNAAANAINAGGNWNVDPAGVFISTGTVTFDAASGTNTITPGGVDANHDFHNIVFNDAAGSATFQLQGALAAANDVTITDGIVNTNSGGNYALTVGHDLTINGGNLTANGSTITVAGSIAVANISGLFTKGTSTVDLTGTGNIISPNYGNRFHIVKMAAAGKTTTMTGSFRTRILELGAGTLSNSSGQINIGDDAGTGETVLVNAGVSTSGNVFSLMVGGSNPVNIQGGNYSKATLTQGSTSTVTVTNASLTLNRFDMTNSGTFNLNGFNLNVAAELNIGFSSNAATFNAGSGTITVGSVYVESSGGTPTLNLDSATLYNAGAWTVQAGGIVNPGTSTVVFNGTNQTITGNTTFKHFTKSVASAATLTFAAGSTTTINGTATLNGASGQILSLRSSSPGTRWNIVVGSGATKSISYVDVSDSDASGSDAAQKPISPANSADGGNCIDWFLYKPDSMIKLTTEGDGSYLTNDVYEATASVQVKSDGVVNGLTAAYNIKFGNDGDQTDSFLIIGTAGDSGFTVQYLDDTATDRTTDVTGAGYTISNLAAGAAKVWTVNVTPSASTTGGTSYNVYVTSESVQDGTKTDQVKAVTTSTSANLTLLKSRDKATADPGEDITYSVTATNGSGLSSASNVVVTDPIPANTGFKTGGATFNAGTSTLSAALSYSNDSGSTWTYTPASGGCSAPAGYDYCVTNVKWTMTGSMPTGTNFSIGLVVRVK